MRLLFALVLALQSAAPEHVSFPTDDSGVVHADIFGRGNRSVVLVHGGRFTRRSWVKQALMHGPKLPRIRAAFEKVTGPKELVVVDGDAHAQFLFESDQADRVMREILRFLSAR